MVSEDTNSSPVSETDKRSVGEVQHCSLMVRGGLVIPDANENATIEDGAVCIQGDKIVAVGKYKSLRNNFIAEKTLGSTRQMLLPGLVNAHDHVRAPSTLQLGIPDDQLELWILDLLRLPNVDPYLSAALASMRMIESGVTTVAHSFYEGGANRYESVLADTIRAIEDTGIRATMVLSILDQSFISFVLNGILPDLPDHLSKSVQNFLSNRRQITVEEYLEVLRSADAKQKTSRVRIVTGAVSIHWCSEELLLQIWREAEALDMSIQTHLLESRYQQRQSLARYGKSAVEYMDDLGLLSSRLSCAHCVHVTERDIELLAASGTSVVHNASSNLRLSNGIAPIESMRRHGVNIALGLDSLAQNDDDDMLHEMRLVSSLHRASSDDQQSLTTRQLLAMASINGARALGIDDSVGTLEPGKKADLILLDRDDLSADFADSPTDSADLLLHGARASDVCTVIVNGEIVLHEGKHAHLDKEDLQAEITKLLRRQPGTGDADFNAMITELKPYAEKLITRQVNE
jgi:5-methylthioadenosine/S-adenosylhomocysteine deaminase